MMDGFEAVLAQARQALQSVRSEADPGDVPAAEGTGSACDGLVQVTVEGRRLAEVTISPRALRLPAEDLAEGFRAAANAALAEVEAKSTAEPPPITDPAALSEQLERLQEQSARQMARYTRSIDETLARMRERG
ncbi:MAG: YbaB/EbfC family nucleoid-associated protein [Actinoplanes sp.]